MRLPWFQFRLNYPMLHAILHHILTQFRHKDLPTGGRAVRVIGVVHQFLHKMFVKNVEHIGGGTKFLAIFQIYVLGSS